MQLSGVETIGLQVSTVVRTVLARRVAAIHERRPGTRVGGSSFTQSSRGQICCNGCQQCNQASE